MDHESYYNHIIFYFGFHLYTIVFTFLLWDCLHLGYLIVNFNFFKIHFSWNYSKYSLIELECISNLLLFKIWAATQPLFINPLAYHRNGWLWFHLKIRDLITIFINHFLPSILWYRPHNRTRRHKPQKCLCSPGYKISYELGAYLFFSTQGRLQKISANVVKARATDGVDAIFKGWNVSNDIPQKTLLLGLRGRGWR